MAVSWVTNRRKTSPDNMELTQLVVHDQYNSENHHLHQPQAELPPKISAEGYIEVAAMYYLTPYSKEKKSILVLQTRLQLPSLLSGWCLSQDRLYKSYSISATYKGGRPPPRGASLLILGLDQ